MGQSIIRSIVNRSITRHHMGETKEIAKDIALPAALGAALGFLGGKGHLDHGRVPLDAVGGVVLNGVSIFTPFLAQHRDMIREVGSIGIAVGVSRVASGRSKGSVHGEFDNGAFGMEPLVAAAANL